MKVKLVNPLTPEEEVEMWMMLYNIAADSQSVFDMLQKEIKDCCLITRRLWDKLENMDF
jgi:hypothetical protein